jgi:Uma2 family endonuclease
MTALPKARMTSRKFLEWASAQAAGRYELIRGEIVAMAPERARHVVVKLSVAIALRNALKAAGAPCTVLTDGISVVIDDETTYEPDATVQCGVPLDLDAVVASDPTIVVEVSSPSSAGADAGSKLADYLTVPSIAHVLIVDPLRKITFLYSRTAGADVVTRILRDGGPVRLDPPGIEVDTAAFFEEL